MELLAYQIQYPKNFTIFCKFEFMSNAALNIRHKLYDYIRVADDKKLQAIYLLLENEMENTQEWWKIKC